MKKYFVFGLVAVLPFVAQATSFDVAHIREQGQDMIVFPMNSSIDYKSDQQKREIMFDLQRCASSARLADSVVIMWEGSGQTKFMAPQQWSSFFRSVNMLWLAKNINKKLSCR